MEPEREGDDKERADDGELEERLQHVREHDHVDPQEGELPHVGEQVQPSDRDAEGTHLERVNFIRHKKPVSRYLNKK